MCSHILIDWNKESHQIKSNGEAKGYHIVENLSMWLLEKNLDSV